MFRTGVTPQLRLYVWCVDVSHSATYGWRRACMWFPHFHTHSELPSAVSGLCNLQVFLQCRSIFWTFLEVTSWGFWALWMITSTWRVRLSSSNVMIQLPWVVTSRHHCNGYTETRRPAQLHYEELYLRWTDRSGLHHMSTCLCVDVRWLAECSLCSFMLTGLS